MPMRFRCLSVLSLVLSACSAAPQASGTTPLPAATSASRPATAAAPAAAASTPAPNSLSGEMTYAWWGTTAFRNQVTQDVINLFQQKYPNVKIDPSISDLLLHQS